MSVKHELYYSSYCYFCQKVLAFLQANERNVELKSTSEQSNATALMQGGGKTQVPCLRIEKDDGSIEWMYESDDIVAYLKQA